MDPLAERVAVVGSRGWPDLGAVERFILARPEPPVVLAELPAVAEGDA